MKIHSAGWGSHSILVDLAYDGVRVGRRDCDDLNERGGKVWEAM